MRQKYIHAARMRAGKSDFITRHIHNLQSLPNGLWPVKWHSKPIRTHEGVLWSYRFAKTLAYLWIIETHQPSRASSIAQSKLLAMHTSHEAYCTGVIYAGNFETGLFESRRPSAGFKRLTTVDSGSNGLDEDGPLFHIWYKPTPSCRQFCPFSRGGVLPPCVEQNGQLDTGSAGATYNRLKINIWRPLTHLQLAINLSIQRCIPSSDTCVRSPECWFRQTPVRHDICYTDHPPLRIFPSHLWSCPTCCCWAT